MIRQLGSPDLDRSSRLFESQTEVDDLQQINLALSRTLLGTGPETFQFIKELGKGAYGTVFQFKHLPTDRNIVVKSIKKQPYNLLQPYLVQNEIAILKYLAPNCRDYILCFLDQTEDQDYYYILTEFLGTYITLDNYIKNYQPKWDLVINLLEGLRLIYNQGVAHRDIKPENIMVEIGPDDIPTDKIKYIDFGLSCMITPCTPAIAGTPIYMAPESFTVQRRSLVDIQKMDFWSLGLVIFEMTMGVPYHKALFREQIEQLPQKEKEEVMRDYKAAFEFNFHFVKKMPNPMPDVLMRQQIGASFYADVVMNLTYMDTSLRNIPTVTFEREF